MNTVGFTGLPIAEAVGSGGVTAETLSGRGCVGSPRWALQPAALSPCLTLTATLPFGPSQTPHLCQSPPVTFSLYLVSIFYPPLCYCRFLIGLLSPPRAISVCSYLCNCCFIWEDKYTLLSCWCHCIKDLFYRLYRVSFKGKKKKTSIKNAWRIWTFTREYIQMRSTHSCAQ